MAILYDHFNKQTGIELNGKQFHKLCHYFDQFTPNVDENWHKQFEEIKSELERVKSLYENKKVEACKQQNRAESFEKECEMLRFEYLSAMHEVAYLRWILSKTEYDEFVKEDRKISLDNKYWVEL